MATATKKAAPKKSAPAAGEAKKVYNRRSPAEVLQNRIAHLEAFDAKYLEDRAKFVAKIEKLQQRVSTPIVSDQDVAEVVAQGMTPEQIKANVKRMMAIAKKLEGMSPEEQAELLNSMAAGEPEAPVEVEETTEA